MSLTAHIPSHRKPRRSAAKSALRAGVAGGVLSTIAVAGAAAPANAAEPVTETTLQMPTLSATQVAAATEQAAADIQQQAQQDAAAQDAAKAAKKAKAEAVHKAEAKKKAEAAAKAKAAAEAKAKAAAAERASRSATRTTLKAVSVSSSQATGSAAAIVSFVTSHLGDAYVMGGTGSNSWDCSGLVQAAYKSIGVDLPRVSQGQSTAGTQVSLGNLQPGDILYWGSAGSAYHVAIYVGGGQFIGAQNPSSGVVEHPLSYDQPTGAVRVL
ncbi:C40 family peptidase [Streptomyces sp. NPDC051322]|uniref:C40 family peptidase n=1 Tax=Streptomyces sp. NPDC051322 TaxID=3154645 RepID=UPI00344EE78F